MNTPASGSPRGPGRVARAADTLSVHTLAASTSPDPTEEAQRRALRRVLAQPDLTLGDLWLTFFAHGGSLDPGEVEEFLAGHPLPARDRALLAHAANQRLNERNAALQVPAGPRRAAPGQRPGTALRTLLDSVRQASGSEFGLVADRVGRSRGVQVVIYLVDDDRRLLVPFSPPKGARGRGPLSVERTLPGRAFRTGRTQTSLTGPHPRWWIPVYDGAQLTGVLDAAPRDRRDLQDPLLRNEFEVVARLIGRLVSAAAATGDAVDAVRQTRPRTVAAELLWRLLPPLTAETSSFSVSALLEPAAEVGGDVFDYALGPRHVDLALFDAMGHALNAGLMASATLAAYRTCRRSGGDLPAQAAAIDDVLTTHFPDALVTGVLLHLDQHTGRLTYLAAGHPVPLVLRDARVVAELSGGRRTPFGLPLPGGATLGEFTLQPGDWLALHTDGVEEARDASGRFFGRERLEDLLERAVAADLSPAETARRLTHAIMDHQGGDLQDDATILLARWRGDHEEDA